MILDNECLIKWVYFKLLGKLPLIETIQVEKFYHLTKSQILQFLKA